MQSDKIKNTEEKAEKTEVCEVTSEYKKQRFGLKIFPETLEIVDTLFKHDNCKSRSEFIEKAVRVYFEQGAYGNGIYCPAANGNGGRNSQRHGTEVVPCLI